MMKVKLYKVLSIILVVTVFFCFLSISKANKVEAAGAVAGTPVPFVSLPSAEQDIFYEALERFAMEVFGYDTSPETSYTMPDGSIIKGTKSEVMEEIKNRANQEYINAMQDSNGTTMYYVFTHPDECTVPSVLTDEFCSTTHKSYSNGVHGGAGKLRVEASAYNSAVSDIVTNSIKTTTGSSAGITLGISTVNGKPQKVTTTYNETSIEVFDYLQIDYKTIDSLTDMLIYYDFKGNVNSNISLNDYWLPFVIKDNKIYVMSLYLKQGHIKFSSSRHGRYFNVTDYGIGIESSVSDFQAFRFANVEGQLCICYFGCSSSGKSSSRYQYIYGSPAPSSYPVLFDTPSYYITGDMQSNFENRDKSSYPIVFLNPIDTTDVISNEDILNHSFDTCGYFISSSLSTYNYTGALGTACKMLGGTENAVQGGTKTTYSDLSDIEKAIYALAKQNGKTYEEMLEQSNLVVENGQIYLEGLDGMTHTIESLLTEFDKLLEQGNINNENTAASVEQLKAILEYLKGLNIEGLGEYIRQLETTLDGLKQGDENREAILGDISGQLDELKKRLDSLGLESVGSDIKSISENLAKLLNIEISAELDISETIDKFNTPDSITTKFPFSLPFDIYNVFNILSADPVAPQFEIPIDMTTIGGEVYTIDIDLSEYDFIANIVRWLLYGVFLIGLILLTNRLIGRG